MPPMPPRTAIGRPSRPAALLALALALGLVAGPGPIPTSRGEDGPMTAELRAVVEGNTRFALDLYARLGSGHEGNLFFSPGSLSTALAMTSAGAAGETATQMARVLHLPPDPDALHPAFAALRRSWDDDDRLSVANRLWGQQDFDFRPGFLATTREHYGAELARVDFLGQPEPTRRQINAWVEEQTRGKIVDLIPRGVLGGATRLVLTNAVHFKGDWSAPFDPKLTRPAPFHLPAGRRAEVPLMDRQGGYPFWAGDGLKALELPYGDGDLAMVVLLPDAVDGLPALEAGLSADALGRWLSGLRRQDVRVHLPRFSTTSQFQLADTLSAMGMDRAFAPDLADFSGMSTEDELFLSAVVHKAFVDVNEEGTEAAAATGVAVSVTAAVVPREPAVFRADHPFLFLIRDTRTGSLLFLGRLTNPTN